MDLWYDRSESPGTRYCIKVAKPLFSGEGERGRVDVFETEDFGMAMSVDGSLHLTEADGFAYREMLVHVPLNVHPGARSALVIGGGDGCAVSEILRHAAIERIVAVDDDEILTKAAKAYFPELAASLTDPRVRFEAADGPAFVRDCKERFDIVIVSGSRSAESFGQPFYCDCFRLLSGDGIFVQPTGSAFFPARRRELVSAAGKLKRLFPIFRLYRVDSPSGEAGSRLIAFASKRQDPIEDLNAARWASLSIPTRYYDPDVHRAAFALPRYVRDALAGA
jgi:spermidine synthase